MPAFIEISQAEMTGLENIISNWNDDNYVNTPQDRLIASGLMPALLGLKSVCTVSELEEAPVLDDPWDLPETVEAEFPTIVVQESINDIENDVYVGTFKFQEASEPGGDDGPVEINTVANIWQNEQPLVAQDQAHYVLDDSVAANPLSSDIVALNAAYGSV